MGREWEFSFRLAMRPWIFIGFSAPVIAALVVFIVYPIVVFQPSISWGLTSVWKTSDIRNRIGHLNASISPLRC
jgi:hypothetical protein